MDSALNLAPLDMPAEPSWWPLPAAAWWGLGGVALVVLIVFAVMVYRYAQGRMKRIACRQLAMLEQTQNIALLDQLLRRIALTYYPRNQVAGLTGEQWLAWLDGHLPAPKFLPLKSQWQAGLYTAQPLKHHHWQACIAASRLWIDSVGKGERC